MFRKSKQQQPHMYCEVKTAIMKFLVLSSKLAGCPQMRCGIDSLHSAENEFKQSGLCICADYGTPH